MKTIMKILWGIAVLAIVAVVIANIIIGAKLLRLQEERQRNFSTIKALENELAYYKAQSGTTGTVITDTVYYENPEVRRKYKKAIGTITDLEGKIVKMSQDGVELTESFEKRLKELMLSMKIGKFEKSGQVDVDEGKYTVGATYIFPDDIMEMEVLKNYEETTILIPPLKKKLGLFLSVALNARKAESGFNYGVNVGLRKPDLLAINFEIEKQDSIQYTNFEIEAEHRWKMIHTFGRYYSLGTEDVNFLQVGSALGWKALRIGCSVFDKNEEKTFNVFAGASYYKEYNFGVFPVELYTLGRVYWSKDFDYEFYVKAKSSIFMVEFRYNSLIDKNFWASRIGIEFSM